MTFLIRLYFWFFLPTFILSKAVSDTSDRVQENNTNASKSSGSNFTAHLGFESLSQIYEECDCGSGSTSCKFDENRKKKCTCKEFYAPKISSSDSEEYCESCYCENQPIACEFDSSGLRKCTCRKGFAPYAFRMDQVCVSCVCGIDELACAVDYDGFRKCICGGDSVAVRTENEPEEKCEKCSCGPNSISCKMFYGYKNCNCSSGYVAKDKLPLSKDEECVLTDDSSTSLWKVAVYVVSGMVAVILLIILMLIYRKHKKRAVIT